MTDKEFEERFEETWAQITTDAPLIASNELKSALDLVGYKLPNHQVRELLNDLKNRGKLDSNEGISKEVFKEICKAQRQNERAATFKTTNVITDELAITHIGEYGAKHMILKEEQLSFSQWINTHLKEFSELSHLLPLKQDGSDLYEKIGDGILLCKMINFAVPDTIDSRAINKGSKLSLFKKHENLTLAITSAKAIGCNVINMDSHILMDGKDHPHIVLGIVWQVIARFLFDKITLQQHPGLMALLQEGETIEDLLKLSPEQLLLRWVNYQLEKAGCDKRIHNFSKDITDSVAYNHLMSQIAPKEKHVNKLALQQQDLLIRAEETLKQAEKLEAREFVTASDIVNGVEKLNLAFVANLFNQYPGLEDLPDADLDEIQETREEKMYRNWMNSLGVDPYVNYLYTDLMDGLILFQIFEFIKPGIVNWKRVTKKFSENNNKKSLQILENCNYAVELGRKINLVLVGIQGHDIQIGNKTLTLGLVWQLMKKYTLNLLAKLSPDGTPIVETEILNWANQRLAEAGKEMKVKQFHDPVNKTALPVIHLIDSIKSGVIDYSIVKTGSNLVAKDCMSNAKYAITMARRIGAPIYALPEDLAEVKHKMVMTVYASLMLVDRSA